MKTYYYNYFEQMITSDLKTSDGWIGVSELVAKKLLQKKDIEYSWVVWNNTILKR